LRLPALVCVFDNNPQTHLAIILSDATEDPNPWSVHLHDRIGPFRRRKKQRVDGVLHGHRISIKRDDGKAVPW
jgi:hypothetical protein